MTAEERTAIYTRISELTGDNEEVMELLAQLQKDADENQPSNYTDIDVMDKDGVRWSEKYAQAQKRYRERFFGGASDIKEEEPEEKPDEAETINFDDLFKKEEK